MPIKFEVLHIYMPKYWTKIKFSIKAVAILDFCTNKNNSAADWHRLTKFCTIVAYCNWNLVVRPKWKKIINSRRRLLPFWILSIAYNSFTTACICTKFGMSIKFGVLHTYVPKYLRDKIQSDAVAIWHFCTNSKKLAANWCRLMKFIVVSSAATISRSCDHNRQQ